MTASSNIMIVLGFDFGTKNLGVAVGNRLTETAQPLVILPVKDDQPDWDKIQYLIDEWRPNAFVVGIPYTFDRYDTEQIRKIRKFMGRLHGRFGLPVYEVDESLTSVESEQYLKPSQKMKKGQLDAFAAALIIERWLNSTSS